MREGKKLQSDGPLCFTLKSVVDRLDCTFNDPRLVKFEEKLQRRGDVVELARICDVTDGNHDETEYVDDGVPLLTMKNIQEDGIDLTDVKYITKSLHLSKLKRSALEPNNVIMTKLGSQNHAFVVPENFGDANTSAELAVIKINNDYRKKVNPYYLAYYLSSDYARKQTDRRTTGLTTRDRTVLKEIRKVKVVLPDIEKQNLIVKDVSSKLKESIVSIKEFEKKVDEINTYFDHIIGFQRRAKDMTLMFTLDRNRLVDRIDCNSNSPNYNHLISEIENYDKGEFTFVRGEKLSFSSTLGKKYVGDNSLHLFKYLDIGNTDKKLGEILGFEEDILINLPSRARKQGQIWDVLLPMPQGSSEGVIIIDKLIDNLLTSTGFISLRNKSEDDALILWTALRSRIVQDQLFFLQSGSLQPSISLDDFKKKVMIPLPNEYVRKQTLKDIRRLRTEAVQLLKIYQEKKKEAKNLYIQEIA